MKIPSKIKLQLIDEFGKPFAKDNVLFKFKIVHLFIDDELFDEGEESWNECVIATDNFGRIYLDQVDIINKLQLFYIHDLENYIPKKIIIENCSKQDIEDMKANRQIKLISSEELEESYYSNNIQHMELEYYIETISQIINHNNLFIVLLENSQNSNVEIEPDLVEDRWNNESEKYYQFITKEKK